jgi:chemotaxis family two-component system response regulator Rcp1
MMNLLKVLLAEDNRGDVFLVRAALKQHRIEHELMVVADGDRALNYISRIGTAPDAPCPDVFLLDLNLPKADGHEVLQCFRAHPLCRTTPVIVVTSSDAPRDRRRVEEFSDARYFRKPTEIDEFFELGDLIKQVTAG